MENIEEKRYWVWFSLIPNLGSIKQQRLLQEFKTPEKIYNASKKELMQIKGIRENIAEEILNKETKKNLEKHLQYLKNKQINIVTIQEPEYPEILKNIYDYPISLYTKGNTSLLNDENIAIIGSRECSYYGKSMAEYFGYNLAKNNKCIISGLARGIDSYAHIGALKADGKTIAVLGNGLQDIYPTENRNLANIIIKKGGLIITEYPLGTRPEKVNFPARNRIISGISKKVLVVEAKEKSGTLITVDLALEQGRDVFAVPGNISSIYSVGTNDLIKQGANIATNYKDLLE